MKAIDIMTQNVITTTPEASVDEAVRLMLGHNISGLPVVGNTGTVVGIVTEGDLLRRTETGTERQRARWLEFLIAPGLLAEEYKRSHGRKVGEVMTAATISVTAQTPLAEVVALMESRRVKRLPVVENGRLIGIVSRADLLRVLAEMLPKSSVGPISDADIRRRVLAEISKQSWAPHATIDD
jgi:CBS domain-containing protein